MLLHNLLLSTQSTVTPVVGYYLYSWGSDLRSTEGQITNADNTRSNPITTSWTAAAAGLYHTVAIDSTNKLYAWGDNTYGQVGDGTTLSKLSPVLISTSSWTAVSAGAYHTLAIRSGGTLFGWGQNTFNQVVSFTPVSWTAISQGYDHTIGIRSDNVLFAWGENQYGQLGTGDQTASYSPVQIGSSNWSSISAGVRYSLAIRTNGSMFAWGWNDYLTVPTGEVAQNTVSWTQIASGYDHYLGIDSLGRLYGWGDNTYGQAGGVSASPWTAVTNNRDSVYAINSLGLLFYWGLEWTGVSPSPTQIGSSSWTAISAGGDHVLGIRSGGTLFAWGGNTYGELGDGTTDNKVSPVQIGTSSWTAISAGGRFSLAIRSGGTLFAWGRNNYGQVGLGTANQTIFKSWTQVSIGANHIAAIDNLGRLWTWGDNSFGQLGDGTTNQRSSPALIGSSSWVAVSAGQAQTAAIRSGGTLFTWGAGTYGSLGDGTTTDKSSPVQIGTSSWAAVSTGSYYNLAIRSGGTLFAWGDNSVGNFGDGTVTGQSSPVQIGTSSWTAINAGWYHNLAIRFGGSLFSWGENSVGQLGDGTTINRSSPVLIGTSSWTAVSLGRYTSMAIRSGGTLFTWGSNNVGQIGDNTTIDKSSPVQIGTSSWTAVISGTRTSMAVRSDSTLWTWGDNFNGTLGYQGTNSQSAENYYSSPVQIGPQQLSLYSITVGENWENFTGGVTKYPDDATPRMGILTTGGRLFTWGLPGYGLVIGEGSAQGWPTNTDSTDITTTGLANAYSSPIQIGTSSWTAISAGGAHSLAIRSGGTLFAWGNNDAGQLGIQRTETYLSPMQVGSSSWTALGAGGAHSLAIRSGGTLFTWGSDYYYQLGRNSPSVIGYRAAISPIQIGTSSWTAVAAESKLSAAVRSGGSLFTWGYNTQYNLGDNTTVNKSSPVLIGQGTQYSTVSLYATLTDLPQITHPSILSTMAWPYFAIRTDGIIEGWGSAEDYSGDWFMGAVQAVTSPPAFVANPTPQAIGVPFGNTSSPVQIGTSSWTAVAAGEYTSLAIRSGGSLYAWGRNNYGQVGNGAAGQQYFRSWTVVSIGKVAAYGIDNTGALYGWGAAPPAGNGPGASNLSPTLVGTSSWTAVSVADSHVLAIRSGGTLFAWGDNTYGQVGQFTYESWTQVVSTAEAPAVFAIRSDGRLFTWGQSHSNDPNTYNFVNGDVNFSKNSPYQIGTSSWTAIAAGYNHWLGIRSGGTLFSMGWNGNGQLGDGTVANAWTPSPTQVGTSSWTAIAAGHYFNLAIRFGGTLFSWGANTEGQLGDPALGLGNVGSPHQIGTSSWSALPADNKLGWSAAAIRLGGTLFTWGFNGQGQLGTGDTTNYSSPVQIGTSSWTAISVGQNHINVNNFAEHMLAIRSGGSLFAWGWNGYGQVGYRETLSWTAVAATRLDYYGIRSNGLLFQMYSGGGILSPVQIGTSSWTAISAGWRHFLAIRNGGTLFAWSDGGGNGNANGGLGTGDLNEYTSPYQIGSSSWSAISAGDNWSMAIRLGGTLFTWGYNGYGNLGNNFDTVDYSSPIQIGTSSWTALPTNIGGYTAMAIRSGGTLFTWGRNDYGQLGDGTTFQSLSPIQIGTSSWTAVASGYYHGAAIRSGGTLFTWGYNGSGALGDGTTDNKSSPIQIGTSSWTAVAALIEETAAIRSGGTLFTWGYNNLGQLGNGTSTNRSSPVQVAGGALYTDVRFSLMDASGSFAYKMLVARRTDSIVEVAGSFPFITTGIDSLVSQGTVLSPTPIGLTQIQYSSPVLLGTSSWTAVSAGNWNSYAVRSGGTLFAWGINENSTLGDGTSYARFSPTQVSGPRTYQSVYARAVYFGSFFNRFAFAREATTGFLNGIGDNTSSLAPLILPTNQLGITSVPVLIGSAPAAVSSPVQLGTSSWTAISAGNAYSLAIRSGGTLFTWGYNQFGQAGDGTLEYAKFSPTQIATSSWTAISAGLIHAAAIRSGGTLFTWGDNLYGQLGFGDSGNSYNSPLQIGTSSWTAVTAGTSHTAAIRSGGTLFTWGRNDDYGQLGDGTSINRSSPVQIGTSSWTAVYFNPATTRAIRSDGTLFAWGLNNVGQVGDGTTINRSSPVQIAPSYNVLGTNYGTMGYNFVTGLNQYPDSEYLGILDNGGILYTWGYILGTPSLNVISENKTAPNWDTSLMTFVNDTPSYYNYPKQLGTSSWTAIASGGYYNLAIRSGGTLFAWGLNEYGQLGAGNRRYQQSPLQIGTSSWTAISAARVHNLAIRSGGTLFAWGSDFFGQLGLNQTLSSVGQLGYGAINSPYQIGSSSWTAVAAGWNHSLAVRSGGTLFAWGSNDTGQLGNNDRDSRSSPQQIGTLSWTLVRAGGETSYAIRQDGRLYAWGYNGSGQIGDGTVVSKSSPVIAAAGLYWNTISSYYNNPKGIIVSGRPYDFANPSPIPVISPAVTISHYSSPVLIGTSSWTAVAAGPYHALAIRSGGTLFAWGDNLYGRLGAALDPINSPYQIGTSSWAAIDAGLYHNAAIRSGGTLFTWGYGEFGQLGFNNLLDYYSPVQIGTSSWTAVAAHQYHTAVIRLGGTLFTVGRNNYGQLGNSNTVDQSNLVQIATSSWVALPGPGGYKLDTTVAVRSGGTLFTWGYGDGVGSYKNYQLGHTDKFTNANGVEIQNSPVAIDSTSWSTVGANLAIGYNSTFAVKSTGELWSWGDFFNVASGLDPLRVGTTIDSSDPRYLQRAGSTPVQIYYTQNVSSPTQIGTSSWASIGAGIYNSAAIRFGGTLFTWGVNSTGQSAIDDGLTYSWTQVAYGANHGLALRSDGKLYAWGDNGYGQLGTGDTIYRGWPVQISTSSWTAIAAGATHSLAIRSGGTLFAWGENTYGQIGANELTSWTALASVNWGSLGSYGRGYFGIRGDGKLFYWGQSPEYWTERSLGTVASPVQIGNSSWVAVAAGGLQGRFFGADGWVVAIRSGGTLFTWGFNSNGQLGDGTTVNKYSPVQIGTSSWVAVAAGPAHTLAIRSGGTLFAWGRNDLGQLGTSNQIAYNSPVQIGTSSWTALPAEGKLGFWNSAAIRSGGTLFTWGKNQYGQLGTNDTTDYSSPVQIGTSSWTAVSIGYSEVDTINLNDYQYRAHMLAIRSGGTLFAWGDNSFGQLGTNDTTGYSSPVQIGTSSWTAIAAGAYHSMAVRSGGTVFVWGRGTDGYLGDGGTVNQSSPIQISTRYTYTKVINLDLYSLLFSYSIDQRLRYAIRQDGGIFGWGNNDTYGLFNPAISSTTVPIDAEFKPLVTGTTPGYNSPYQIGSSSWTAISAGRYASGAIRSAGTLFTWGSNQFGALGDNTTFNRSSPMQIGAGVYNAISVGDHSLAINSVGTLFAMGLNDYGQLGFNDTINRSSPVQIGASSWTAISVGLLHSAAIRSGGTLFTWGRNAEGQLGFNDLNNYSSPVQIGASSWTLVAAGYTATYAQRSGGTLWAWGATFGADYGYSNANTSSPVQVGAALSYVALSSAKSNTLTAVVRSGGTLYTWGGQELGNGSLNTAGYSNNRFNWWLQRSQTTIVAKSPTQIGTSSWTMVALAQVKGQAIRSGGTLFAWGYGYGNDSSAIRDRGSLLPDYTQWNSPIQIGTSSWTAVASNDFATYAVGSDTNLYYSGLRQAARENSTTIDAWPTQVGTLSGYFGNIAVVQSGVRAVRTNGNVYIYGSAAGGFTTQYYATSENPLLAADGGQFANVYGGPAANHTILTQSNTRAFVMGLNDYGQLGINVADNITGIWNNPIGLQNWADRSPVQVGTLSWIQVAAGLSHTVGLRQDGAVFAWGDNTFGQLGDGTRTDRLSPTQIGFSYVAVAAGDNFSLAIAKNRRLLGWGSGNGFTLTIPDDYQYNSVSAYNHVLAIRNDGKLWAWGRGAGGLLGDGTTVSKSSPVLIGSSSWSAVDAGISHSMAIRSDGTLFAWGINSLSQLGDGTTIGKSSPVQISASSWTVISVAKVLGTHSLAIRNDGILFAWGRAARGQLGIVVPDLGWISISAGAEHTLGIKADYKLYGWGKNTYGQLGDGTIILKSSPVQIGTSSWIAVAAGLQHSAAIRSDGRLFTWGAGSDGKLGDNTVVNKSSPVLIGTSSWTAVAAGNLATAAIRSGGTLFTWGRNAEGQLGDGTATSRSSPVQIGTSSWTLVSGGLNFTHALSVSGKLFTMGLITYSGGSARTLNFKTVAMGGAGDQLVDHGGGITPTGTLWMWGRNANGQLGNGATAQSLSPVQIGTSSWTALSAGASHTVAIRSGGTLFAWGAGTNGLLGDITTVGKSSPVQIGTSSWTNVGAGRSHNLAIRSGGTLFAWGDNQQYQLGYAPTYSWTAIARNPDTGVAVALDADGKMHTWGPGSSSISQIGTSSWTAIAGGNDHMLAIRSGGTLFAFNTSSTVGTGNNSFGRLGDGTTIAKFSPVQIGTSSWVAIAAGYLNSMAIRSGGTLFAWGYNFYGQLGDGSTVNKSSPQQIGTSSWTALPADGKLGLLHSAAIRSGGTLFTWGYNLYGQLGDGTRTSRSSPVQIGTSSWSVIGLGQGIENIAGRGGSSFAINVNGSLYAWGNNFSGQLGDGTTLSKSSPVLIGTSSWVAVSAGVDKTLAIRSGGSLFVWGPGIYNGDGTTVNRSSPVLIDSNTSYTTILTDALLQSIIVSNWYFGIANNQLRSWGNNALNYYILGRNASTSQPTTFNNAPFAVSSPTQIGASSWTAVSSGGRSGYNFVSAAIRSDGTLWMWGLDNSGMFAAPNAATVNSWTMLARSTEHTLAIRSDGLLFAWGRNNVGQLGDGTTVNRLSPQQIGSSSWTFISVEASASAAISSDYKLYTWGLGSFGRLGDGTTIDKSSPVQIGNDSWIQVSTNPESTYAIRSDNKLFAWGRNNTGQLGDGTVVSKSSPVLIGTSSWSIVGTTQAGRANAIDSLGRLYGWGSPPFGEYQSTVRSFVALDSTNIAGSGTTHYAIDTTGKLYAWGIGTSGQLGDSTTISKSSPVLIGTSSWTAVAASAGGRALAIRSGGTLFAWGSNTSVGALGDGTTVSKLSPVQIGTSSWIAVAAAGGTLGLHNLAIRSDGRLFSWGRNNSGQLGVNDTINRSSPAVIGTDSWTAIAAGTSHSMAIRSDGKLFTWGDNSAGQLGNQSVTSRSSPVQIGTDSWVAVSAGDRLSLAIRNDGRLFAWGSNFSGELGDGTTVNKSSPVQIGNLSWSAIKGGNGNSAGIINNNLYVWGSNNTGVLGDGTTVNKSSPVQINSDIFSPITLIGGLGTQTGAILAQGEIFYSGVGLYFNVGSTWTQVRQETVTAGTVNRSSPVLIGSNYSWVAINSGSSSFAINTLNQLWAWGTNSSGELGDRSTITRSSPVQIGAAVSWSKINNITTRTFATDTSNRLYAWGLGTTTGDFGLGAVTTPNRSSPTLVNGLSFTSITHAGGITPNNLAVLWGNNNNFGQLGYDNEGYAQLPFVLGSVGNVIQSSPVQVNSGLSWSAVSVGIDAVHAISSQKLYVWGWNYNGSFGNANVSGSDTLETGLRNISPVLIHSDKNYAGITSVNFGTRSRTFALEDLGSNNYNLWAWGDNSTFALGDETSINRSSPVLVTSGNLISIAAGPNSSLFTANVEQSEFGYTFGSNIALPLATVPYWSFPTLIRSLNTTNVSSPIVIQADTNWSTVAAIGDHTLGITSQGILYAWGRNTEGQLGLGDIVDSIIPRRVGKSSWAAVGGGGGYAEVGTITATEVKSAAIRSDGRLFTWGRGATSGLGDGTTANRSSPVLVGTADNYATITAGLGQHVIIRANDNTAVGYGINSSYQLIAAVGNPSSLFPILANDVNQNTYSSPTQVNSSSWTAVSTDTHTLAIHANGSLYAWGENTFGELGDGSTVNKSSPVLISTDSWIAISAGHNQSAAIRSDGQLFTWGRNVSGSLGNNTNNSVSSPTVVSGSNSWIAVRAIGNTTIATMHAISSDSKLYAWGDNTYYQFGDNSTVRRSTPTLVHPGNWTAIAPFSTGAFAINPQNRLHAAGRALSDTFGIFGNYVQPIANVNNIWLEAGVGALGFDPASGEVLHYSSPTLLGNRVYKNIAARGTGWAGITTTGELFSTQGTNTTNGDAGIGYLISIRSPVQVRSDIQWQSITVGESSKLAISTTGLLYAWGDNTTGQLGLGNTIDRYSPVQVGTSSWIAVDTNGSSTVGIGYFTVAIRSGGTLFTWGFNSNGQLGDGTNTGKSSPVQIGTSSWISVSAGRFHTAAVSAGNKLFTWGDNQYGQLADQGSLDRSSPVQIGVENWTGVNAGIYNTWGLKN